MHITDLGYTALAQELVWEASRFEQPKQKGNGSIAWNACLSTREWQGFISHSGEGKADGLKAQKSNLRSFQLGKSYPYTKREGGRSKLDLIVILFYCFTHNNL